MSQRNWPVLAKKYEPLEADLDALIAYEGQEHPSLRAGSALKGRVPKFVRFEEPARNLASTYDLLNEDLPEPETAIHNLLALVETSWAKARGIVEGGDPGRKERPRRSRSTA